MSLQRQDAKRVGACACVLCVGTYVCTCVHMYVCGYNTHVHVWVWTGLCGFGRVCRYVSECVYLIVFEKTALKEIIKLKGDS